MEREIFLVATRAFAAEIIIRMQAAFKFSAFGATHATFIPRPSCCPIQIKISDMLFHRLQIKVWFVFWENIRSSRTLLSI